MTKYQLQNNSGSGDSALLNGVELPSTLKPISFSAVFNSYSNSRLRLLLLDYDGTLVPIQKVPSEATPSNRLLAILRSLSQSNDNTVVFIISGRDQAFLDSNLGKELPNIGMSAEHGSFLRLPGVSSWTELFNSNDTVYWKHHITPIFERFTQETPGSFIEDKVSSMTWHYRLTDPIIGEQHALACLELLQSSAPVITSTVEILTGKKNIEVRPGHINKGQVVKHLVELYPIADFILCCGDDKTDEDMFAWISENPTPNRKDILCLVDSGGGNHDISDISCPKTISQRLDGDTKAKYYLKSTYQVQELLETLSGNRLVA
jgi:trehalose 6-phosphate synthase/phosphatase